MPRFSISALTIDCANPDVVSTFWSKLLGPQVEPSLPGWSRIDAGQLLMNFQPVQGVNSGTKNPLHLDLIVDDVDVALQYVEEIGGAATGERHDYEEGVVVVAADPEENEFCLVHYVDGAGTPSRTGPFPSGRRLR